MKRAPFFLKALLSLSLSSDATSATVTLRAQSAGRECDLNSSSIRPPTW